MTQKTFRLARQSLMLLSITLASVLVVLLEVTK